LNIEILTQSEVVDVAGQAGNFNVTVKKHPRFIDMEKCIACGICAEKCPKKVDDEFNMGLAKRKAAYIQYGQTVPLKYVIDPVNCIYLASRDKGKKKCLACEKFCPTGAINFEEKEAILNFNVGSLILSPGYSPFDPSGLDFYGYKKIPDVITSLEYERMLSAGGPFHGHLEKPSDGKEPHSIAWIQCVGSRNTNRSDNGYCSSVCCMYAMKQALVTATHIPGGGQQTIFNMDVRSNGKEFELYYQYAREQDVRFVKARPHTIEPGENNTGVSMTYFTEDGRQMHESFDMAVLSIGMEASKEIKSLAEKTGIMLSPYNFAETSSYNPSSSNRDGIFIGGSINRPMNIPTAVAMASSAASEATKALVSVKNTLTKEKKYPPEKNVVGQEPRIGVFVCSCGVNIANIIDVASVVAYAESLPNVVFVENNMFSCSTDTQNMMAKTIVEKNLNRIVIAACSPRTHEPLFQDTLKEIGLNGYLIEMANIRNQNAWVHQKEPEKATQKAKDQVRMAVAKVRMAYPLAQLQVDVIQKALVIGGGLAGINSALGLADHGYETVLLEKTDHLGGNAVNIRKTAKDEEVGSMLRSLIQQVENHDRITVLKNARLLSASGVVGSFSSEISVNGGVQTVEYGAAILATGGKESVPTEYLYGTDDRVMTHLEFDGELTNNSERVSQVKSAVFIQCVGSRDENRNYCSRICCTHAVKSAIELKERNADINVYVLYRDIRTYGINEDFYTKARQLGVMFIRYEPESKPEVFTDGNDLCVRVTDPIIGRPVLIDTDYLVLGAAVEPNEVNDLVKLFRCATNQDGFLNEAHPKLRPVDMAVDGLFVAGLAHFPKTIEESISQANAAVSRAGVILSRDRMHLDAVKSFVTDECDGCAVCLDVCPYDAISLIETPVNGHVRKKISTAEALCKGCGLCEATCPKEGVQVHNFTSDQLRAQVYAALDLPN
jgi:heterodisulfide reductase subunit A2